MFDNLKQLHKLKQMQDEFKKEVVTVEKQGVKVTLNGNFEVQEITLNAALSIEDQQKILKDVLNEAREKIQKALAGKVMGSGFSL